MQDNKHVKSSGKDKAPIHEKGWLEFRKSGLLFLVNQFLHIFGWCIVYQYLDEIKDIDNSEPSNVFVARTTYRGFGSEAQERGYKSITKYMLDNSDELLKEFD